MTKLTIHTLYVVVFKSNNQLTSEEVYTKETVNKFWPTSKEYLLTKIITLDEYIDIKYAEGKDQGYEQGVDIRNIY